MSYKVIDLIARKGKRLQFKLLSFPDNAPFIEFISNERRVEVAATIVDMTLVIYGYMDGKTKRQCERKYKRFLKELTRLNIEVWG